LTVFSGLGSGWLGSAGWTFDSRGVSGTGVPMGEAMGWDAWLSGG
jgi:hypothetical protein